MWWKIALARQSSDLVWAQAKLSRWFIACVYVAYISVVSELGMIHALE